MTQVFEPAFLPRRRRSAPDVRFASGATIAELSALTGATARALRHYEDEGLLSPYRSRGGTRRFSPEQRRRAQIIVRLRDLDMPISEIRAVLDDPAEAHHRILRFLDAQSVLLDQRLSDVQNLKRRIGRTDVALDDDILTGLVA